MKTETVLRLIEQEGTVTDVIEGGGIIEDSDGRPLAVEPTTTGPVMNGGVVLTGREWRKVAHDLIESHGEDEQAELWEKMARAMAWTVLEQRKESKDD